MKQSIFDSFPAPDDHFDRFVQTIERYAGEPCSDERLERFMLWLASIDALENMQSGHSAPSSLRDLLATAAGALGRSPFELCEAMGADAGACRSVFLHKAAPTAMNPSFYASFARAFCIPASGMVKAIKASYHLAALEQGGPAPAFGRTDGHAAAQTTRASIDQLRAKGAQKRRSGDAAQLELFCAEVEKCMKTMK